MQLIRESKPVSVQLSRSLTKTIKQGHAWVYADSLRNLPEVEPGTPAILLDNRGGKETARGYLDSTGPIALRICSTHPGQRLTTSWAERLMRRAISLRSSLFAPFNSTNAYRLFNGEGDGLPGLVCDIYGDSAVLVTDGVAPQGFWQVENIAKWLVRELKITSVFHQSRVDHHAQTTQILGATTDPTIIFMENGLTFSANPISGQKTGFFLDQRDNREFMKGLSSGKRLLNLFGYTGGFSVYAGVGGADHVTTLDISETALEQAHLHWQYNQLPEGHHTTICADAFEHLSQAAQAGNRWDLVILDPPSFAPSEASVPQAVRAYTRLVTLGAQVISPSGLLAAASCSSHIRSEQFLDIVSMSISSARRKASILGILGQPPDHPYPLAMPELRYLKFVVMQLD